MENILESSDYSNKISLKNGIIVYRPTYVCDTISILQTPDINHKFAL